MPQYVIGKMLKEARIRKQVSQEDLCFGLCAVSTLSKIENGVQNPSKKVMEALLQRLGFPLGLCTAAVAEEEFERGKIEQKILSMVGNGDCRIQSLLESYVHCSDTLDPLETQFYLFMSGIQKRARHKKEESALPLFTEALRQTIPDFLPDAEFNHDLLTITELMILNNIALEEYRTGKKDRALKRLYFVKTYFEEKNVDPEEKAKQYPVILFNLCKWEESCGNYVREIELAEKGIVCCIKYGKLAYFDLLLFCKGEGLSCQGHIQQGKKYFIRAFILMAAKGMHERIRTGIYDVKKKFGYDFSEFEALFW